MLRAAQTTTCMNRSPSLIEPSESSMAGQTSQARETREAREAGPARPARDWSGVREGFREVFLTLAATLAIGFAWAAIEMERLESTTARPGPAETAGPLGAASFEGAVEVARLETGYAAVRATGR